MKWIVDSGHAWLEVPTPEAEKVTGISAYSYRHPNGSSVYLEEDCDAGLFAEHYGIKLQGLPVIRKDGHAALRNYPRY
jgi:hypothetical protein